MNKCPNCGHENRAGEILCIKCSVPLVQGVSKATRKIDDATQAEVAEALGQTVSAQISEDSVFPTNATLRLEIVGSPMPIKVKFTKANLTLGRRDPATGALPDIDLAPFAGYRMGVSRRHSELRRTDEGYLELLDLGSSNGTFLNGQRLTAHTPHRVQNRDRMALGQIVMEVIYQMDVPTPNGKGAGSLAGSDETKPTRPNENLMTQPTKPEKLKQALQEVSDAMQSAPEKPSDNDEIITKPIDSDSLDAALSAVEKENVEVEPETVKLTNEVRESLLDEAQKSADEIKNETKSANQSEDKSE